MNISACKPVGLRLGLLSGGVAASGAGQRMSRYAQVAAQLKLDLSGSGGVNNTGTAAVKRGAGVSFPLNGAGQASPQAQIVRGLAAARDQLSQIKGMVGSAPGAVAPVGLQGKLMGLEQQYSQLDLSLQNMPSGASPQQWMVLQGQMYSMSEDIGVFSKVVSQLTSGVKSILQTQV